MAKKTRRRWAAADKKRLATEAHRLQDEGWTLKQICDHLDVLGGSLRLWMRQHPRPQLQPVQLIETELVEPSSSGLRVTLPSGVRIEGMTIEDVVVLLEVSR